jgi:hypothetical protein
VDGIMKKNSKMGMEYTSRRLSSLKDFGNLVPFIKVLNLKINQFIKEHSKIIKKMEKGNVHG